MTGEEVIQALAAASRAGDPLMANVLATEAVNRMRRVRAAIQSLGEGICLLDPDGRLTLFNPAAERITGWQRMDVEGLPIEETVAPTARWREVVETRRPLHVEEERFLRKEGAPFPVSCTIAPVILGGDVDGVVIVFRDVTAEKRAEEDRRVWRRATEAVYEAHDVLGEGLVLVAGQRVSHANATFERMSGYSVEELKAITDLRALIPPAHRPALAERMARVAAGEPPRRHLRLHLLRKDGRTVAIEVAAIPIQGDPPPPRIVCIVREIPPPRATPARWRWARERKEREKKIARKAWIRAGRRGPRGPSARP
jgi:PAS domain S-box-containing protein